VGGWLAEKWNLPPGITHAIRFHHEPLGSDRHREIALLACVADFLVRYAKIGDSGNKEAPALAPEIVEALGKLGVPTENENLEQMRMDLLTELDRAEAFFSILKESGTQEP
jgi:HD-like signal output (HDOD) protein